jgi:flagellar export protein FliJ
MKFKFSLQKVLDWRLEKEKELAEECEQMRSICNQLQDIMQGELKSYFAERDTFNATLTNGQILRIGLLETGLELRKRRLVDVLSELRRHEAELTRLMTELQLAKRDVKTVENLKENREKEFYAALDERERKFVEEISLMRYVRKEGKRA